jgi:hypothetical protein
MAAAQLKTDVSSDGFDDQAADAVKQINTSISSRVVLFEVI